MGSATTTTMSLWFTRGRGVWSIITPLLCWWNWKWFKEREVAYIQIKVMPLLLVKRISSKKVASVESDSYPSRSFPHQHQQQRQQELFCPQFPPVWFLIRQQRHSSATSATLYISHYCLVYHYGLGRPASTGTHVTHRCKSIPPRSTLFSWDGRR